MFHPTQNRTISVREAARLQGFPDKFRFALPELANAVDSKKYQAEPAKRDHRLPTSHKLVKASAPNTNKWAMLFLFH